MEEIHLRGFGCIGLAIGYFFAFSIYVIDLLGQS
jgi:hypothetical protein